MSDEWNGKSVLVLGLGDTGLSSVRWLAQRGARVRAADSREAPPALGAMREAHPGVGLALGPFDAALLAGVDTIVASPGVALREPVLQAAVAAGIEVLGDVEIFAREAARMAPAPVVVGVTGTNGKSTVTALAAAMGTAAGRRSVAAGNIGLPVLDALEQGADFYAIELSSYQLETTSSLRLDAATMLNLSQDHLDRYDSMEDYAGAKARIFRHCGTRVLNRDDAWSMRMQGDRTATFGLGAPRNDSQWGLDPARERLLHGGREIAAVRAMAMKGLHNAANALAAHALATSAGLDEALLADALTGFAGLPHRVQLVAEARGVRFYDDSKGTNVGASVAALEGFTTPVVLIAGGDGKQQDFGPLAPAVAARARAVVLIGRDAPRIQRALASTGVPLAREATMEAAVAAAFALAKEGDAVLLSPACASFDMFRNYGHRGEVFAAAARAIARGAEHSLMLYNPARPTYSLDPALLWPALLLLAVGLVMVYSSSIAMAEAERFTGFRSTYFLQRHGIYLAVGLAAGFALFKVPVWLWQKASPWLFMLGTGLLVLVLIPGIGREVNGSRRWIPMGIAGFQPSEIMKLFVVLYAADYTVRKAAFMDDFRKGFLPMFAVMTFIAALLLREPDFGALVVVTSIAMAILFLGGLNWRLFAGLAVLLAAAFVVLIVSSPYRLQRILGFMDPWADAFGKGYQLSHSLIAFGRGEIFGQGLGSSVEKLHYLPEAHTDFLLAVIAEELGFAGVAAVIGLFVFLVYRAFAVGRQAASLERYFAALVAQGIGVWLTVQAFINMGVNMGLLPTKGLTLPLLSFGGTGIVVNCAAIAILLRIDWENRYLMRGKSL